jgi:hypothetical protein
MRSVPGANILAFFGLSFFPVVPLDRSEACLGFKEIDRHQHFVWPLWSIPASQETIAALLAVDWASETIPRRQVTGIFDIRASQRLEEGKAPKIRYYFAPSFSI